MKYIILTTVIWFVIGLLILVLALACGDRGPANSAVGRYNRKVRRELEQAMYGLLYIWMLPLALPLSMLAIWLFCLAMQGLAALGF